MLRESWAPRRLIVSWTRHLERHCRNVLDAARDGEMVFLLGAGVNLCGRPEDVVWEPRGEYLPTGQELADYLAPPWEGRSKGMRSKFKYRQVSRSTERSKSGMSNSWLRTAVRRWNE
jgi:hypothetical protein